MGKLAKIRKIQEAVEKKEKGEDADPMSSSSSSEDDERETDDVAKAKNSLWTNRERCLVFCARGADFRCRHLMNDIKSLLPHSKGESKLEKTTPLPMINEIAEMKNCTSAIFFENKKHKDVYMWMSNIGVGPSIKFHLHNVHTMMELKLSGNCLKNSRPILSFDAVFDTKPHLTLIKHVLTQIFATPNHHPRSQPFIDHVFTFSLTPDDKIWFRNFQVVDETMQLQEIGPRMVLELIRIFSGSFEGSVLYDNPNFTNPNLVSFSGSFEGSVLYDNPNFTNPNLVSFSGSFEGSVLYDNPNFTNPNLVSFSGSFEGSVLYDNPNFTNPNLVSFSGSFEGSVLYDNPNFTNPNLVSFSGSFEGSVLYDNPNFTNPNLKRRIMKLQSALKYNNKKEDDEAFKLKRAKVEEDLEEAVEDPVGELYDTETKVEGKDALHLLRKIDEGIRKRKARGKTAKQRESSPFKDRYVKLNVGGSLFQTTLSTLVKHDGMLRAMFSDNFKTPEDSDGWVVIDRSGKHFSLILDYLRDGNVPLPECRFEVEQIQKEAAYYILPSLQADCESWLSANSRSEQEVPTVCRVPIVSCKTEAETLIKNSKKPVIKFFINRHNNKYSYTNQSDDNILKNLELFDRLLCKFHDRILFIKDIGSENTEVCQWKFYGWRELRAEVCCTSIVYATDKKHTKVEFPDSRIYDEAMSILRYENRFICNRCGGEECSSVTEGQARERQRLDVEKMGQ